MLAQQYRELAAAVRAIAGMLDDDAARQILLTVAADYEVRAMTSAEMAADRRRGN